MSFKIHKFTGGFIKWKEFENKHLNIPKQLVFVIIIKFQYELDKKMVEGSLTLDLIRLKDITLTKTGFIFKKVSFDWTQLNKKVFDFPINPKPGYIDGSFFLLQHNPCDITHIEFTNLENGKIDMIFDGVIDFTFEKVDTEVGTKKIDLKKEKVTLTILN